MLLSALAAAVLPLAPALHSHAVPTASILRQTLPALSILVEEHIGVDDAPNAIPPLVLAVSESLAVGASPTTLPSLDFDIAESIGVSASVALLPLTTLVVDETIGVGDMPNTAIALGIQVIDDVGIRDIPAAGAPLGVQVSDTVGIGDTSRISAPLAVSLKDGVGIADALSLASPRAVRVEDGVGVRDSTATSITNPGRLQFTMPSYNVHENTGTVTFTVARTGGSDGPVSVQFKTQGGTATAGEDYLATNGELSWQDGETGEKSFTITVLDDKVFQGDMTVTIRLSSTSHGAGLSVPTSTTLTVQDNERLLTVGLTGTGIGVINGLPESVICLGQCTVAYEEGAIVTLTAVPLLGTTFAGWSGVCSGTDTCTVTMTEPAFVLATFNAPAIPALTMPMLVLVAVALSLAVTVTRRRRGPGQAL